MKSARMGYESKNESEMNSGKMVDVLYQKMGDRWFAFSLIDDEVFMGSISQKEIDAKNPESSQEDAQAVSKKSSKKPLKMSGNS